MMIEMNTYLLGRGIVALEDLGKICGSRTKAEDAKLFWEASGADLTRGKSLHDLIQ